MTNATHHPYSAPKDFDPVEKRSEHETDSRKSRYESALRFCDQSILKLENDLREFGRLENTIFIVTGDHGQAFADRHSNNLNHKNFLYEENIRNFLLIYDPTANGGPYRIDMPVSSGDIAPTIADLVGSTTLGFFGRSLLNPDYKMRIHYFYKNASPEKNGLVDGNWKFITRINPPFEQELFNLALDPLEQENLAKHNPELTTLANQLVRSRYVRANENYVKHTR